MNHGGSSESHLASASGTQHRVIPTSFWLSIRGNNDMGFLSDLFRDAKDAVGDAFQDIKNSVTRVLSWIKDPSNLASDIADAFFFVGNFVINLPKVLTDLDYASRYINFVFVGEKFLLPGYQRYQKITDKNPQSNDNPLKGAIIGTAQSDNGIIEPALIGTNNSDLIIDQKNDISILILNRPLKLNAINMNLLINLKKEL